MFLSVSIVFDVCLYLGQLWRPHIPLLGIVWWPRRFWCSRCGLSPSPSPHCSAPSGGAGDPLHTSSSAPDLPGWGAHQSASHPDVAARPNQGRIPPRCRGGSRLPEQPTHTLLHREESLTREHGDGGHRECFQRHGKRHVLVRSTNLKV